MTCCVWRDSSEGCRSSRTSTTRMYIVIHCSSFPCRTCLFPLLHNATLEVVKGVVIHVVCFQCLKFAKWFILDTKFFKNLKKKNNNPIYMSIPRGFVRVARDTTEGANTFVWPQNKESDRITEAGCAVMYQRKMILVSWWVFLFVWPIGALHYL